MNNEEAGISPIQQVEWLAARAWPAAEVQEIDGWWARYANGVTRRANSVWPNVTSESVATDARIEAVAQFYAERRLPARYQISPAAQPADLDDRLAALGYAAVAHTAVQVAELNTMLTNTPPLRRNPEFTVEVAEAFDEQWFSLYVAAAEEEAAGMGARRAILQRIADPVGFVLLQIDAEPAAVGLGVIGAGWLGIFCMGTLPAFRRRGAARAILRTLAIWAQMQGAERAYLQVMAHNTAAQSLYTSLGFTTLYHYHYREQR
ncbi:MAG: GNAT family N-acetyltransferase [Caldilineaceae bacterium]|nr:GNAT family N-acetyltransferase [Caldilineaceae bacterium]